MTRSSDHPLVFCGTPQFAVPTLEKLAASGFEIKLVLTQPDRPKGRGLEHVASPVKQSALRLNLPIYQPGKIKTNEELQNRLRAIAPDAIIIVGYGRIIPKWMLEMPRHGNINLHASLLPKYRGAAPIQWAIARGEKVTGVTTMRIDEGLDTGDVLLQQELVIGDDDTSETLAPRLAAMGADLMVETLRDLEAGAVMPKSQNHSEATLAPILTKEDGRIEFHRTAQEIYNRLRGFQPWPGAFTKFRGKMLGVTAARPAPEHGPDSSPSEGQLLVRGPQLFVSCGQGSVLELLEVQPEGKKRMAARDFVHGYRPQHHEAVG
jgi:methionyl-tRNA formyltransferase